jgi:hypothetical protein
VPQAYGLRIDNDGNIDANGNTHIGGNCTINGNTTIGGNASFGGNLDGASGSFRGTLNGVSGNFTTLTIKDYIRSQEEVDFGPGVGVRPRFTLRQDGSVESYGGFYFGSNVSIAGACDISGSCTIGQNATFKGILDGAQGNFRGKLVTSDVCQAAGFVLSGLQPGYIKLIYMNVSATERESKWQIPASGRIKMYGTAAPVTGGTSDVGFYVNNTLIKDVDTSAGAVTVDFDFDVQAGDIILISASQGGGVVGGKATFTGGLYTNTENTLVGYLGKAITTNAGPQPR